ncbi:aromatic amino acid lyase [Bartonella bovis]|uniref:aromatic amino acid lyase n=1 Tax=Bartonella bovis TaxID=155194 RepID=UPI0003A02528|nr:aromatic amino acid lyase [Bartonella bovis]
MGEGFSGVQLELVNLLENMLNKGVIPVISEKGSVSASGDLALLADMAAVMIGEGRSVLSEYSYEWRNCFKKAGLSPVVLEAKEGVALINGTQTSIGTCARRSFRGYRALCGGLLSSAMFADAIMGSTAPFHPDIHILRGHHG